MHTPPARTHTRKMHAHALERGQERGAGESGAGDGQERETIEGGRRRRERGTREGGWRGWRAMGAKEKEGGWERRGGEGIHGHAHATGEGAGRRGGKRVGEWGRGSGRGGGRRDRSGGRKRGAGQGGGREEQKMPTGRRQHASFHGHAAADQADSDYPSQFEKADAGPKRRGRLPHTFVGRGWGEEGRGGGEEGRGAAKSSAPIAHAYAHARGANTRTLIHDSRNQALRSGSARYTRKDAKRRRFGYRRGGRRSWSERGE